MNHRHDGVLLHEERAVPCLGVVPKVGGTLAVVSVRAGCHLAQKLLLRDTVRVARVTEMMLPGVPMTVRHRGERIRVRGGYLGLLPGVVWRSRYVCRAAGFLLIVLRS